MAPEMLTTSDLGALRSRALPLMAPSDTFSPRPRTSKRHSSSSWALRLVYGLQFGAALCPGRVNGCEIVQQVPLHLFAGTGIAAERPGRLLLSRCANFSRPV